MEVRTVKAIQNELALCLADGLSDRCIAKLRTEFQLSTFFSLFPKSWGEYNYESNYELRDYVDAICENVSGARSSFVQRGHIIGQGLAPGLFRVEMPHADIDVRTYTRNNCEGIYINPHNEYVPFVNIFNATPDEVAGLLKRWNDEFEALVDVPWAELLRECQKKAKIKTIGGSAVTALLKHKLAGSGVGYHLEYGKVNFKVLFNIGSEMLTITVSEKNFMAQLDTIVSTVLSIKKLRDETKMRIKIGKVDDYKKWELPEENKDSDD